MFTKSSNNILPLAQLHVSECKQTIGEIMKMRLNDTFGTDDEIKRLLTGCMIYDLADAEAIYAMLNHSGWTAILFPYLCCECAKGISRLANFMCRMIDNAHFTELYNSSLTHWNSQMEQTQLDNRHKYDADMHH